MPFDSGQSNAVLERTLIDDIVNARNGALKLMEEAAAALGAAYDKADQAHEIAARAANGHGFYLNDRTENETFKRLERDGFDADASLCVFRKYIDACCWVRLLKETGLENIMDRQEREELDAALLSDVPEINAETIRATFERLAGDADLIFKRGLANAFSTLDRRFKSHDAFKLGSRIILTGAFNDYGAFGYMGRARENMIDVERVFAVLDGRRTDGGAFVDAIKQDRGSFFETRQSETETRYFTVRGFKNGNAHLWFRRDDLVEKANQVLADYYGRVVPDAADETMDADAFKAHCGTHLPAKDLQFYESPEPVVQALLYELPLSEGARILEPSAGHGAIVRPCILKGAHVDCVELHPDRVERLRSLQASLGERMTIIARNFLSMTPTPAYDLVLMNPPFHGVHWMKHVRHAFGFLKDGGVLRAVLPASAHVNETKAHLAFRRWAEKHIRSWRGQWTDLPPESFAAAGVRIQTVILELSK